MKQLIELINENSELPPWKIVYQGEDISTYKKTVKGISSIMLKSIAEVHFHKDVVFEAIANTEIRLIWDDIFNTFKIIDKDPINGEEVLYMSMKV